MGKSIFFFSLLCQGLMVFFRKAHSLRGKGFNKFDEGAGWISHDVGFSSGHRTKTSDSSRTAAKYYFIL